MPFIKIGENNPEIEQDIITMHWDADLARLYIGFGIKTGNAAGDGARAVVVGRLDDRKLIFEAIAPNAVFEGGLDKIVGLIKEDADPNVRPSVSIHQIKTMFTSTALHYLIVRGGNGVADTNKNVIFALPLVSGNSDLAKNGTIANKRQEITADNDVFSESKAFLARTLKEPANVRDDMTISGDTPAQVGAGSLNAGDITDMFVRGDTVFVTVGELTNPGRSGMFYSQALLKANGRIKGWTPWQRVAGTTNQAFGLGLDSATADFIFMTGDNAQDIKTVKRTIWSDGDEQGLQQLTKILSTQFSAVQLGIHGLFDFPQTTPALHEIAMLIATGQDKVVLVQTGQEDAQNIMQPTQGDAFTNIQQFENGSVNAPIDLGTRVVSIAGGALGTVGPIIAAELVRGGPGGNNGWLCVGGGQGLAILAQENGQGWTTLGDQLASGFVGLFANNMPKTFKKIGNYRFVRTLISDSNFLYVLTDTQLDRIALTPEKIVSGNLEAVTIATPVDLAGVSQNGSLSDCIISEKFALLATSAGLFRVGNGRDIGTAQDSAAVGWVPVEVNEGIGPITKLIAASKTTRAQDVAKEEIGGQVYVLSAYRGKNQAQINRFAVQNVVGNPIGDETIAPFSDIFVEDIPSYFANLGQFKDLFTTDGALYFNTQNARLNLDSLVRLFPLEPEARTGNRFLGTRSIINVPIDLSDALTITALLRNIASGSWIISGNFGIQVNE